jgi:hypothetical protein
LLIALPKFSDYRPIFDALLQQKFKLAISSTYIFQEYIEIITRKAIPKMA